MIPGYSATTSRADVVSGAVDAPIWPFSTEPSSNVGPAPPAIYSDRAAGCTMTTPLWEWCITWNTGRSVGLSATRHGAMGALSRSLVSRKQSATGQVVPVLLVEPAHEQPYYLRGWPKHTAVFDGVTIKWQ